ncbi:MAG: sugar phosphate nucleotidyltransferase [Planctomycetota bacterium]|nr:sugar phosphate nucleotidyltransferase [Planctomycetota bacterium]
MSTLFAVLMAGGSGTRFWPASRKSRPKQFLPIGGETALLQRTSARLGETIPPQRQLVITAAHTVEATRALLKDVPPEQIVGEPEARDTSACVGLATCLVEQIDPEATVIAMPADQLITPEDSFREHLLAAEEALAAHPERVLVFGVEPTRAEQGYGWLRRGAQLGDYRDRPVFELDAFVEKPGAADAEKMLKAGGYAWNAGMFAFRLQAMRAAFQEHLPDVWAGLKRITADWNTPDFAAELAREFPRLPKISIDKGVMEKLRGTLMLPLPLDWDDVGSWSALERLREADKAGNVVDGRAVVLDAQNNLLASDEGCVVAVKGVDGLIVVHTADATLVCRRDDDQGVKALVKELEARGLDRFL